MHLNGGHRDRDIGIGIALWTAAAPFAFWAALRWSGHEPGLRWGQLVAFTPYVAVVSTVLPLTAMLLRRRAPAIVTALIAAALVATLLPRTLPDGQPPVRGPQLRVVALNLLAGSAPPDAVVALVRRTRADVLTLQEVTPEAVAGLDKAGLRAALPHRVVRARPGVTGSAIYARHPLRELPIIELHVGQARSMLDIPGGPAVEIVSVHPCAPAAPSMARCWRDGLRALPRAGKGATVRILAGDFNATLDHLEVRRLLGSGYRDAADATGAGLRPTWPGSGSRSRITPPVVIDHVLADRRVAVRSFRTHEVPLTDHRAVYASLVLPTPSFR